MQDAAGIGILGGTFNPVHVGHLMLGRCALEAASLERVLFVPCATPPHKHCTNLAPAEHRRAMLELALQDSLDCEVCDIELVRGGISYAVDTVRDLHELYPRARLHFIIGADTLRELHLWKDIYGLLALCTFIAFRRPGGGGEQVRREDIRLDAPWPERLLRQMAHGRRVEVSSSEIRYRVAEGLSIQYLTPQPVAMYIAEHGLYA